METVEEYMGGAKVLQNAVRGDLFLSLVDVS